MNNAASQHEDNSSVFGGLFDLPEATAFDPDEERFRRQMQRKKKKKRPNL